MICPLCRREIETWDVKLKHRALSIWHNIQHFFWIKLGLNIGHYVYGDIFGRSKQYPPFHHKYKSND